MEPAVTTDEVLRLLSPRTGHTLTRARWKNIYHWYHLGWTFEQLGEHFNRHPSTIKKLLKRAAQEEQKELGYKWPVGEDGRKICDIHCPMPKNGNPWEFNHVRAQRIRNCRTGELRQIGYCPVCRRGGHLFNPDGTTKSGKTLMEVLCSSENELIQVFQRRSANQAGTETARAALERRAHHRGEADAHAVDYPSGPPGPWGPPVAPGGDGGLHPGECPAASRMRIERVAATARLR